MLPGEVGHTYLDEHTIVDPVVTETLVRCLDPGLMCPERRVAGEGDMELASEGVLGALDSVLERTLCDVDQAPA